MYLYNGQRFCSYIRICRKLTGDLYLPTTYHIYQKVYQQDSEDLSLPQSHCISWKNTKYRPLYEMWSASFCMNQKQNKHVHVSVSDLYSSVCLHSVMYDFLVNTINLEITEFNSGNEILLQYLIHENLNIFKCNARIERDGVILRT